jgi:hypothetical protein
MTAVSDDEVDQLIYGTGGASASAAGGISIDQELLALQNELNK